MSFGRRPGTLHFISYVTDKAAKLHREERRLFLLPVIGYDSMPVPA